MPRFEIVVTDADHEGDEERPWTAGLWQMDEELKTSGDLLVAGCGKTPMGAVQDLLLTAAQERGYAIRVLRDPTGKRTDGLPAD